MYKKFYRSFQNYAPHSQLKYVCGFFACGSIEWTTEICVHMFHRCLCKKVNKNRKIDFYLKRFLKDFCVDPKKRSKEDLYKIPRNNKF